MAAVAVAHPADDDEVSGVAACSATPHQSSCTLTHPANTTSPQFVVASSLMAGAPGGSGRIAATSSSSCCPTNPAMCTAGVPTLNDEADASTNRGCVRPFSADTHGSIAESAETADGARHCSQSAKRRRLTTTNPPGHCGKGSSSASSVLPTSQATPQTCGLRRCGVLGEGGQPRSSGPDQATLLGLASGPCWPYLQAMEFLTLPELAQVDATCRLLRDANLLPIGPWHAVGQRHFFGLELDSPTGFLQFDSPGVQNFQGCPIAMSWKKRCEHFHMQVPTFSGPFGGREIRSVESPDEVAYCRCRLRTDLLAAHAERGVYIEVEVSNNVDNLSLAVVDFEGGGRSSVTFSPETGAVLRERKVRENPRAIEGTYIHLLPAAPAGRRFEGTMGLLLRDGHLAFFRRWSTASVLAARSVAAAAALSRLSSGSGPPAATAAAAAAAAAPMIDDVDMDEGPDDVVQPTSALSSLAAAAAEQGDEHRLELAWETTGFCTDLRWAQGSRLSICLAFRDDGPYNVNIAKVGRGPPASPERAREAYQEDKWN
eukprot:CAMPEP_0206503360 /NCGR_PEP_ID=MMETSP0324_2-20121206/54666_1 /ASSEMBLY_ACC=CAM_ASM_000836 /TAXON_ID=2866 /ORGANISM="Crypthecodinium cohnii, Strain Seligo" /LENGTH=542 /DNA_ID=CAMNT_0053991969 /DNA_START=221 /DNA_END=1846 /DNA_ORIENTATION=-